MISEDPLYYDSNLILTVYLGPGTNKSNGSLASIHVDDSLPREGGDTFFGLLDGNALSYINFEIPKAFACWLISKLVDE